jgi:XRE family transcriptional regulator, regulator of sulfur utilization
MLCPVSDEVPRLDLEKIPGANLKRLRDDKPWTQEKLAERAGLDRSEVQRIEGGERSPGCEVVLKLAGALGVDPGELFRGGTWIPSENRFEYREGEDGSS